MKWALFSELKKTRAPNNISTVPTRSSPVHRKIQPPKTPTLIKKNLVIPHQTLVWLHTQKSKLFLLSHVLFFFSEEEVFCWVHLLVCFFFCAQFFLWRRVNKDVSCILLELRRSKKIIRVNNEKNEAKKKRKDVSKRSRKIKEWMESFFWCNCPLTDGMYRWLGKLFPSILIPTHKKKLQEKIKAKNNE